MSAPIKVGEGYLEITPKLTSLTKTRDSAITAFNRIGVAAGKSMADAIDKQLDQSLGKTFGRMRARVTPYAASAGQQAGSVMGDTFDAEFEAKTKQGFDQLKNNAVKAGMAAGGQSGAAAGRAYSTGFTKTSGGLAPSLIASSRSTGTAAGKALGSSFTTEVNKSLRASSESLRTFGNRLQSYGQNWSLFISAPFIAGLGAAVKWGIETGAQLQKAQIGLTRLLAGQTTNTAKLSQASDKAKASLFELRQYAADTAFEFAPMANGVQRLVAAGVSAKDATHWMKTLGDTSASFGAGSDEMNRSIIAITQSMDAEKINAQDMNQLQNAGIPIWKILTDVYHKNRNELLEMSKEGKLQSKDVWPKLIKYMDQYSGSAKKMAKAVPLENLKNQVEQFKNALADMTNGQNKKGDIIDPNMQKNLNKLFDDFGKLLQNLVPIIGQVLKVAVPFVDNVLVKINNFVKGINEKGPDAQKFAGFFAIAVAAAGPLMVAIGFFVRGIASIMSGLRAIPSAISGLKKLVDTMAKLAKGAADTAKGTKDFVKEIKDGTKLNSLIASAVNFEHKMTTAFKNAKSQYTSFVNKVKSTPIVIKEKIQEAKDKVSNAQGVAGKTKAVGSVGLGAITGGLKGILGVVGGIASILAKVLGPAFNAFSKVLSPIISKLSKAFVPVASALAKALGPGLAIAVAALTPAIISMAPAFSSLGKAIGPIIGTLGTTFANLLKSLAPVVQNLATTLGPLLQQLGVLIGQLLVKLAPIITAILQAAVPLVGILGTALMKVLMALVPVVMQVLTAIQPLIPVLGQSLSQILIALAPLLTQLLQALMPLIPAIMPLVVLIVKLTAVILKVLVPIVRLAAYISGVLIRDAIAPLIRWISTLVGWITGFLLKAFNKIPGAAKAVYNEIKKLPGQIENLGKAIVEGLWNGIKSSTKWLADKVAQFAKDTIPGPLRKVLGIHSPSKVAQDLGVNVVQGLAQGLSKSKTASNAMRKTGLDIVNTLKNSLSGTSSAISKTLQSLETRVTKAFVGTGSSVDNNLVSSMKSANTKLKKLADERAAIVKKIGDADKLAADVTSNAKSFASLTSISSTGVASATTLQSGLQGRLATLKTFAKQLGDLAKRGISKSLLQQIVEAGPEAGSNLAASLLAADKSTFSTINKTQADIDKYSVSLGSSASDALFDAGANAGKGLLAGLQSQKKKIESSMASIANGLVSKIKKAFKIKSPSQVFAEIGSFLSQGLAQGITGSAGLAVSAAGNLASSVTGSAASVAPTPAPAAAPAPNQNGEVSKGLVQTKALYLTATSQIATAWKNGQLGVTQASKAGLDSLNNTVVRPSLATTNQMFASGMTTIKNTTSTGLTSVNTTTKSRMNSVVSTVKSAATQSKDAWKSMASSMNSSTSSLVNVSYGKGVRGMVGAMSTLAGKSNPLPTMHFATGGVVPGFAPGRDIIPAVLSPGEGVLRPEVVRWLGANTIHQWNAMAMGNKFSTGGVVGDGAGWVTTNQNSPYTGYESALKAGLTAVVTPTLSTLNSLAGAFGSVEGGDMKSQYPNIEAWGAKLDKLAMAGAGNVIKVARGELGQGDRGGRDNNLNKYNGFNGEAWCADFVSWVSGKSHAEKAYWGMGGFRAAPAVATWKNKAKGSGRWDSFSHARPGDIMTFGGGSHIGLVEGPSRGGGFTTIEGNHGALVQRVHRTFADGVGHPYFQTLGTGVNPWPGSIPMGDSNQSGVGDEFSNGANTSVAQNKALAKSMASGWGWGNQWSAIDYVISHESGWNERAKNASSGAYGLGQALPGSKMNPYGKDWKTNPATQLKWWHAYVKGRYGNPNGAERFWKSHHWYDQGAWEIPETQPAIVHKGETVLPKKQAESYRSALKSRGIPESVNGGLSQRPIEIHQHGVKKTGKQELVSAFSYIDTMFGL